MDQRARESRALRRIRRDGVAMIDMAERIRIEFDHRPALHLHLPLSVGDFPDNTEVAVRHTLGGDRRSKLNPLADAEIARTLDVNAHAPQPPRVIGELSAGTHKLDSDRVLLAVAGDHPAVVSYLGAVDLA